MFIKLAGIKCCNIIIIFSFLINFSHLSFFLSFFFYDFHAYFKRFHTLVGYVRNVTSRV